MYDGLTQAIVDMHANFTRHFCKDYHFVSLGKQLKYLRRDFGDSLSCSTLKRRTKELIEKGVISKKHRTPNGKNSKNQFTSSITNILYAAHKLVKIVVKSVENALAYFRVSKVSHYSLIKKKNILVPPVNVVDLRPPRFILEAKGRYRVEY